MNVYPMQNGEKDDVEIGQKISDQNTLTFFFNL